jgi:hypothetical protein
MVPLASIENAFSCRPAIKSIDNSGVSNPKRTLAKQSDGEFTPAVSTTRTGDITLPTDANFAEIRYRPFFNLKRTAVLAEWRQLCSA